METNDNIEVRFPVSEAGFEAQDEERCILCLENSERMIRLHDYNEIYRIPGLYEYLFRKTLKYKSPEVVTRLLVEEVNKTSDVVSQLNVLEIGSGNGVAGELLKQHKIKAIKGTDIISEAAAAAMRDRPDVYADYYVGDFQNLAPDTERQLKANAFNCLFTVSALGFGDIPPGAFARAFNYISDNGWIAFNLKESFTDKDDPTGFSSLISHMVDEKILEIRCEHQYCHRLSVNGKQLFYIAVIGRKQKDLKSEFLRELSVDSRIRQRVPHHLRPSSQPRP
jgi:hypothetical protein